MLLGDNHPNNENMIDSKKYHMQRASLFQYFGSKTGILTIFMKLRLYVQ